MQQILIIYCVLSDLGFVRETGMDLALKELRVKLVGDIVVK